jgi:hypothetical protein
LNRIKDVKIEQITEKTINDLIESVESIREGRFDKFGNLFG